MAPLLVIATGGTASATNGPHLYPQNGNWSLCLDVEGGSTADGARIIQWGCTGQTNQYMQLLYAGTEDSGPNAGHDFFQIYTGHGCLDVTGVSYQPGAKIQQYTCIPGQRNQQWFVTQHSNGTSTYSARHSGMCLDEPGGTTQTQPIVQMQQYWCNGSAAQNFWYYY